MNVTIANKYSYEYFFQLAKLPDERINFRKNRDRSFAMREMYKPN